MTADHLAQVVQGRIEFLSASSVTRLIPTSIRRERDYVDQLRELCLSKHRVIILKGPGRIGPPSNPPHLPTILLVMGAPSDRTRLGRLLGSPKDNLTRRSSCSVLWLKTPRSQSHRTFDNDFGGKETEFDLMQHMDQVLMRANVQLKSKESLFKFVSQMFSNQLDNIPAEDLAKAFAEREQMQNTAVGAGVALPHATLSGTNGLESAVAVVTTKEPIEYGVAGGEKVDVFFFTIGAPGDRQTHLKILSAIATLNFDSTAMEQIRTAKSETKLWTIIQTSLAI